MILPSASDVLLALCRRDAAADSGSLPADALADDVFRTRLLEVALRHGMTGLVLARLEQAGLLETLAVETREPLQRELRRLRMRAAVLQIERDLVVKVLELAHVRAVVLKGAGLASTVFPSLVERDFGDIDVLVTPAQLDAAIGALNARGYRNANSAAAMLAYRSHHFHVRMQRPGATIVELHWALVSRVEPFQLDAAAFLQRSVEAGPDSGKTARMTGKAHLRVPCAEHALLHTVVECGRGSFSRIKWLVDIDRIIASAPSIDWEYVVKCAREGGLLPTLWLSLEMSHRLLGTVVTPTVLSRARPSRSVRFHLAILDPIALMMQQRAVGRASSADLLRLWLLAGRSRAAWLATLVTPAADDPLQWLWNDMAQQSTTRPTFARRAARVGKLLADQGATYAIAVRDALTREGRARRRVW